MSYQNDNKEPEETRRLIKMTAKNLRGQDVLSK